jgi:hypothetical protein
VIDCYFIQRRLSTVEDMQFEWKCHCEDEMGKTGSETTAAYFKVQYYLVVCLHNRREITRNLSQDSEPQVDDRSPGLLSKKLEYYPLHSDFQSLIFYVLSIMY